MTVHPFGQRGNVLHEDTAVAILTSMRL